MSIGRSSSSCTLTSVPSFKKCVLSPSWAAVTKVCSKLWVFMRYIVVGLFVEVLHLLVADAGLVHLFARVESDIQHAAVQQGF